MTKTDRIKITTVKAGKIEIHEDTLVQQMNYTLRVNGIHAITSVCSPGDLESLVIGYLATQGQLKQGEEPVSVLRDGNVVEVEVALNSEPVGHKPVPVRSDYCLTPEIVLDQVVEFIRSGKLFGETGAAHSAAISRQDSIECYVEDISRSAALEKTIGCAFLQGIRIRQAFIILSSRVPEAFVRKAAMVGVPMIASISAPTVQAAREAERLGICLCGFVRDDRMNVYANKWRLGL